MRHLLVTIAALLSLASVNGQVFTGTNLPDTSSTFSFSLTAAATNVSITLGGSGSSYSYLMLKRGSSPTDTVYDFSSQSAGQTNAINLEQPELAAGTYWVRVRTPAASQAHTFSLVVETNRTDLRTASRPVSKPVDSLVNGWVFGGSNQYFRVEFATNAFWRISLDSTNISGPDLYVARSQLPTTSSNLKKATGGTNDSVALTSTETTPGAYYIGVFAASAPAGGLPYTMKIASVVPVNLTWDPGTTHLGTLVYTNLTGTADDYYFRISTANPSLGAWRTALRMLGTNDANLYLSRGVLPTPSVADYRSERQGSDGLVLAASIGFLPSEEWFILVRAKAGATWTLVSGSPYVQDLGTIVADASSGSGPAEIGPEGMRYFSASATADMLAWRLYLNGLSNTLYLKKTGVPLPTVNDLSQAGQMLVVPKYLTVGQYFIGVAGAPHTMIDLDSRQHTVHNLDFGASTTVATSGFGYTTYRVQVPAQQIAWQIYLPSTNGNPSFAVRRYTVPNENNNDGYSELSGTNAVDNITLVPPVLSDGTFYITVYATNVLTTNAHQFTLQNGPAVVTDIPYRTTVFNNDPTWMGWRFYRVTDISAQLGSLGWDLVLSNASPGTRIALRRNAAPSIWAFRNPSPDFPAPNFYDALSTGDFLQQPDHPADVWYVGIYNPTNALGNFSLTTRDLDAPALVDNQLVTRSNVLSGRWEFFSIELKTEDIQGLTSGGPVVGWDVRLTNVLSGLPRVVVRRGGLPTNQLSNFSMSGSTWPSGAQWPAGADWTARRLSADGTTDEEGRILVMGVNRPLEAGTYYVGVLNTTGTNNMSYQLLSRWIGPNRSIPVQTLAYTGGKATNTISARDAAYYQVVIPPSTPSWKVRLNCVGSESMLVTCTNRIPTALFTEKRMQKVANEHYVLLPYVGSTYLTAGTNYLVVVGEGQSPLDNTRIGTGQSTYVIESQGALPEPDLGFLMGTDLTATGSLEGGESTAYHFRTLPTTLGFWLTLEDKQGNPWMVSRGSAELADPGLQIDPYGNEGGRVSFAVASPTMIVAGGVDPVETVMIKARQGTTNFPNASYTMRVKEIIPDYVNFDGGTFDIINRPPEYESFFYIDVPANCLGWDLRVTNVTSGTPLIVVSRDVLPIFSNSAGFTPVPNNPAISYSWPSAARWATGLDWTERPLGASGAVETGQVLAMGMNRPLQPGRYYVGVMALSSAPVSCTLVSRGIGAGFSIPVTDLPFTGGTATLDNLAPREAAYYRVQVPTNAASWKVSLTNTLGENLLAVLKDTLPNIGAALNTTATNSGGRKLQKIGDEQFLLVPPAGLDRLFPGSYYLAVVGEGQPGTNLTQIGPGTSSYRITSVGEAPTTYLGTLGGADLLDTNTLNGGESRIYTFNVPGGTQAIEARLENRTGNPVMVMRGGTRLPDPGASNGGTIQADPYGSDGGEWTANDVNQTFISSPNPTNSLYTLIVKARGTAGITGVYSNASYVLRLNASGTVPVEFDQGSGLVYNQAPNTWRYFKVVVPTNALGWDVRLTDVTSGLPRIAVRRETLPSSLTTTPWGSPGTTLNWPTNYQWAPSVDWTRRSMSVDGLVSEDGRILAMGLGRPLEPGTYYVGVMNSAATTNMSYTVRSRGIGDGFDIPLVQMPFNSTITNLSLTVRDAAYYRIVIPSNTPSWKLKLGGLVGETMCAVLRGALPNFDTINAAGTLATGKSMQKLGNEHFLWLPGSGQTNVLASTNYVAVVSEGVNPGTAGKIGTGSSAYYLTSAGAVTVNYLGMVTSEDIIQPDTLEGGEVKAYSFDVPYGTYGVKLLLENRSGNPMVVATAGDYLPDPGALAGTQPADTYGNEGGYPIIDGHPTIATIANPTPGKYSVAVKARAMTTSYPDASYTLRVQEILAPEMNFTADLNTNGLGNQVSGLLQDNERAFFKFTIPATNVDGQPVIGWKLDVSQSSGLASLRVRRDSLPSDANAANQMNFTTASAVIAPPYLTNGVWFVEVKATGSTAFTLKSSALNLQRSPWIMPAPGETNQAPGVVAPTFGQTDIDTNGAPYPKILLEQGSLHYYAIVVPTNNLGLLRATLVAVSGNPDLYLRYGAVPTLYHNIAGAPGSIYDRSMLSPNKTEYANWVPLDGKLESQLKPGLWYLAVRAAGNANAEYVLSLSVGDITDLPLNNPMLPGQLLVSGDWKYYRVQTPTALPLSLNITFSQEAGDVVMHLRDALPPGNGPTGGTTDIKDWANDLKNFGPYPNFDPPGTYTISAAPVRPGQPLYLGFRAVSDASFSVRIATNGAPVQDPIVVPFYGGSGNTTVGPYGSSIFRVDVPPEATRWRHASTHTTNLTVYLDQGTIPGRVNTRWTSYTANSGYTNMLVAWNNTTKQYQPNLWPWVAGQAYFLVVTNTTSAPQDFFLTVDGKSAANDDGDADSMPDFWELTYFGTTNNTASADTDGDAVSNLQEFLDGTNPADAASFRARLFTAAARGTITRNPDLPSYTLGTVVTLTPVPSPGYSFIGWSQNATGLANPLQLTMDGHKNVTATFKLAGDDLITALPLSGSAVQVSSSNVSFTKESGEPYHAGNPGGKSIWWRWVAPASGPVTISTAGSVFNTLLGVYTGTAVNALTKIASDNNSLGGTNRSQVNFTATSGTTYLVAVDGYNGASGKIVLSLSAGSAPIPPRLSAPVAMGNGSWQFTLTGEPNKAYLIQYSADLVNWNTLVPGTTGPAGDLSVSDPAGPGVHARFYRAQTQ